jgi:hypothetical protein
MQTTDVCIQKTDQKITLSLFCVRQHHHYFPSRIKRHRNRNNNQTSFITIDAAECIDSDMEFDEGLTILLAKGNLILNNDDAQMVSYSFQLNH